MRTYHMLKHRTAGFETEAGTGTDRSMVTEVLVSKQCADNRLTVRPSLITPDSVQTIPDSDFKTG